MHATVSGKQFSSLQTWHAAEFGSRHGTRHLEQGRGRGRGQCFAGTGYSPLGASTVKSLLVEDDARKPGPRNDGSATCLVRLRREQLARQRAVLPLLKRAEGATDRARMQLPISDQHLAQLRCSPTASTTQFSAQIGPAFETRHRNGRELGTETVGKSAQAKKVEESREVVIVKAVKGSECVLRLNSVCVLMCWRLLTDPRWHRRSGRSGCRP